MEWEGHKPDRSRLVMVGTELGTSSDLTHQDSQDGGAQGSTFLVTDDLFTGLVCLNRVFKIQPMLRTLLLELIPVMINCPSKK
ncbi:Ubiquitin-60S ribosomal protein L40 [Manis javanica]|nr:Ubiquitin-60S ribosomal protein L40 [Manis javanica]